jgi:hypothetical protein
MSFPWKPCLEPLEAREVPALFSAFSPRWITEGVPPPPDPTVPAVPAPAPTPPTVPVVTVPPPNPILPGT